MARVCVCVGGGGRSPKKKKEQHKTRRKDNRYFPGEYPNFFSLKLNNCSQNKGPAQIGCVAGNNVTG